MIIINPLLKELNPDFSCRVHKDKVRVRIQGARFLILLSGYLEKDEGVRVIFTSLMAEASQARVAQGNLPAVNDAPPMLFELQVRKFLEGYYPLYIPLRTEGLVYQLTVEDAVLDCKYRLI